MPATLTMDNGRFGWQCTQCVNGLGATVHSRHMHSIENARHFAQVHNDYMHYAGCPHGNDCDC